MAQATAQTNARTFPTFQLCMTSFSLLTKNQVIDGLFRLHHPRAGKQSAGLRISFARRDTGIDERILDIGMA